MFPLSDTVPRRSVPLVTFGLILANALIFFFELSLPPELLTRLFYIFGMVPARFTDPAWGQKVGYSVNCCWPFLTSMFLHGGWLHLISNMWTLWIFGDNVEDRMGHTRFLFFYLSCGLTSSLVHLVTNYSSTVPAIGASGAIAGVLGAYFLLFPFSRVIVLVPVFFWPLFFAVPASIYLGVWFLMQFVSGTLSLAAPEAGGGIAWWAHIGGFAAGILLYRFFVIKHKRRRALAVDEYGIQGAWFNF